MQPLWIALFGLGACATLAQAATPDAQEMIRKADYYRASSSNVQVQMRIEVYARDGSLEKRRDYMVLTETGHKTLVLMQSPSEQGQKVLMLGDDFWMFLPSSQRPIRITPTQKLLGEASTGDIATLSWSEDYTGQVVGEEACGAQTCVHLTLNAKRGGLTYQRIELWLGKAKKEPVKADLYVQSEKLAKSASFAMENGMVSYMDLQDLVSNHKMTRVTYLSHKERAIPTEWLNPMFLARNPNLE
ncbi:outer membrane lipoprotein-sorting protein [Duganella sp. FT3S]|uniref:Outer membrane lipoprotein-sorting protein n=1 Tax=Rugamonas fusca TaxID=2758568 RepID=A0A7W2I7Q7_9BURK|nr:outer membrane lipoprotein-sorting protein [Rugamonas fusca]MBA5606573.1 outer membrane lipoprotein-sorting protein [Rugamonas fusca]